MSVDSSNNSNSEEKIITDLSSFFFNYKSHNFQSNEINTLSLGGGGYYGILNIALIRHLEEMNEIQNIKKVYCVSVGTLFGLLILLGYSSQECIQLILNDLSLEKMVEIEPQNIFHLWDKLGINDGSYLEGVIKNSLQSKGFSPYITFKELYEETQKELHVGISYVFKKDFELVNHNTYPDMPVWLALRASTSIPLIFQPLYDTNNNDYICDGGLLCNNPIKYALMDKINDNLCQSLSISQSLSQSIDKVLPNQFPLHKFKSNIISIDFKIVLPDFNVNPTLFQYITSLSRKIFVNQSSYDSRFQQLIHQFETIDYPEINITNLKLDESKLIEIIDRGYQELKIFFENIKN
jgi:predicted acylesterase/phospholipase RssA